MQSTDDSALLRQYSDNQSDEAFAALVTRHTNLVYSVAVRCVGDSHRAEDVAQEVFILLSKKATQLRHEKGLSSWLFQTTRLTASNFLRSESRRHRREQEAQMQLNESETGVWPRIAPLLDDAVAWLNEKDRRAIMLRFYEGKNLREVGEALDVTEDAAEKRVVRAVEKLRAFFAKRGVTVGASGLACVISANAVQSAPVGLAVAISGAATAVAGTAIITTLFGSIAAGSFATKFLEAMGTTKTKIFAGAAVAALVGTFFVMQHRTNQSLRAENSGLREQSAQKLALADLQADNQRLAEQLKAETARSKAERIELMRLRGQVTGFRQSEPAAERTSSSQLQLNGISFRGNSIFTETQLSEVVISKVGEPMDERKLSKDAFAIYELYRRAGHDNVTVSPLHDFDGPPGQVTFLVGEMNQEAGIGVQVAYVKPRGALYIQRVIPNSPAEMAGLSTGLYIEEIDGTPTRALTQGGCVMLLRGADGTKVRVGIWDSEQETNLTFEVTRQKLVL